MEKVNKRPELLQSNKSQNIIRSLMFRDFGFHTLHKTGTRELESVAERNLVLKDHKELQCDLPGITRTTFIMTFSPDGTKMASTHGNHNVYITEIATGKNIKILYGHPRTPWSIAFHPSSSQILASGCLGGQVRVWNLNGGSKVWNSKNMSCISSIALHPTKELVVIATSNEIHFWDWNQSRPFAVLTTRTEKERTRYVAFDTLGEKLITGIENVPELNTFHNIPQNLIEEQGNYIERYKLRLSNSLWNFRHNHKIESSKSIATKRVQTNPSTNNLLDTITVENDTKDIAWWTRKSRRQIRPLHVFISTEEKINDERTIELNVSDSNTSLKSISSISSNSQNETVRNYEVVLGTYKKEDSDIDKKIDTQCQPSTSKGFPGFKNNYNGNCTKPVVTNGSETKEDVKCAPHSQTNNSLQSCDSLCDTAVKKVHRFTGSRNARSKLSVNNNTDTNLTFPATTMDKVESYLPNISSFIDNISSNSAPRTSQILNTSKKYYSTQDETNSNDHNNGLFSNSTNSTCSYFDSNSKTSELRFNTKFIGKYGAKKSVTPMGEFRSYRLQAWDFSTGEMPDITNSEKNIVVPECRIFNDGSIDISPDGKLLAAYFSNRLGIYSLEWETLGKIMYSTKNYSVLLSVSISPTQQHLLVSSTGSIGNPRPMIFIYKLLNEEFQNDLNPDLKMTDLHIKYLSEDSMVIARELLQNDQEILKHKAINCIKWAPQPGQGLVYATSTGQLNILY